MLATLITCAVKDVFGNESNCNVLKDPLEL